MTVPWTSFALTDDSGTTAFTDASFAAPAVLDSGTTYTALPTEYFIKVAKYFNAVNDTDYGWLIACDVPNGSFQYGFGGFTGPVINVDFNEVALPAWDENGEPLKFDDGRNACGLGFFPVTTDDEIAFGDTFLRSAYVVYDLDALEISVANTDFHPTAKPHIVEIGGKKSPAAVSSAVSVVTVTVTVSRTGTKVLPPGVIETATALSGGVFSHLSNAPAAPTTTGQAAAATSTSSPIHTTSSRSSAAPLRAALPQAQVPLVGTTAATLLLVLYFALLLHRS